LITCEIQGIELDYCPKDHGYWFDAGEIEALVRSPVPILRVNQAGGGGDRRCPRCSARMNPHHPLQGLELDLCPHGDGIWFDESELGALIAKLTSQQASGELAHLDHVFGLLATKLGGTP
jgi:Zn-finger nucleic acid-binding protein